MNQLRTVVLFGALTALLVLIGGALGGAYLHGVLALALLMNLGAYFFSDRLVLAMHRAREVSREEAPALHRVVEELAAAAGVPKPRVYAIPSAAPNAFATGRNPRHGVVAVTDGITALLDERELRGVLAHEISHIRNRDILIASVAAAVATAISYLAQVGRLAALFGGGRGDDDEEGGALSSLLLLFLAPVAASLIQLGISRSREYLADAAGARISGDPESLARALEKLHRGALLAPASGAPATASLFIVNPFTGCGGWLNLFSTHPPVEERIQRLRAMTSGWHRGERPEERWA